MLWIKKCNIFRVQRKKNKRRKSKKIIDEKSFNKIFNNKFFYNDKDRNYFDYVNKYSISSGKNCPTNFKQCGILDSA